VKAARQAICSQKGAGVDVESDTHSFIFWFNRISSPKPFADAR
jgi:hypothetical protein